MYWGPDGTLLSRPFACCKSGHRGCRCILISNFSSHFAEQCQLSALLSSRLHARHDSTRVEAACASGGTALKQASIAIASGLFDVIAVVGVEKMTTRSTDETTSILSYAESEVERRHGATFPGLFALMARRHFHDYGTCETDLAKIAVKNHRNALSNPNAHFHISKTVVDVLRSPIIASPLKLSIAHLFLTEPQQSCCVRKTLLGDSPTYRYT